MGTLHTLPVDDHFGQCPKCKKNDGFVNIGRAHWFYCTKHRVKWYGGHDMFPGWRGEHEAVWNQNEELMGFFLEIEPFMPHRFASDEHLLLRDRPARPEECRHIAACSRTE